MDELVIVMVLVVFGPMFASASSVPNECARLLFYSAKGVSFVLIFWSAFQVKSSIICLRSLRA